MKISKESLKESLINYFDIDRPGGTYSYNLTRDKHAFAIGTMTLDDFVEFDEETINDIVDYIYDRRDE